MEAEWLTRKSRIDTRLKQKGWKLVRFSPELDLNALDKTAVEELPTANGPADYGLFVGGRLLGIVEAKKVSVNPANVLEQAKRYQWDDFRVPFLYASNGTLIWHLDARPQKLVSRQLSGFHTPEALAGFFASDTSGARAYLLDTPPEQIQALRPYQRDSILAVEQAILNGKRDMMVAMATGTGKTYLTVAQIYRLLESGLARRILFLVDRKERTDSYLVIRKFKYWVIDNVLNRAAPISNAEVKRRGLRWLARHGKKIGPYGRPISVKKKRSRNRN